MNKLYLQMLSGPALMTIGLTLTADHYKWMPIMVFVAYAWQMRGVIKTLNELSNR